MFSESLQTYLCAKLFVLKCLYTCIYLHMHILLQDEDGTCLLDKAAEDFKQVVGTIVSLDDPFQHHPDLLGPYKNVMIMHQRVDILWN